MATNWAERASKDYAAQQAQVAQQQSVAQQRMQAQQQGTGQGQSGDAGVLGTVAGWLDNMWTDDVTAAPVVGPALGYMGEKYGEATRGISTLLSAPLLAANPMYWENRGEQGNLMADATQVQPGRALVALPSGLERGAGQALGPTAQNVATNALNTLGGPTAMLPGMDLYGDHPNFNIADTSQRDTVFGDNAALNYQSGVADGLATFFLDPLVIGGKAVKIARFGTTAFGLGRDSSALARGLSKVTSGFTNRTVMDQHGINLNVVRAVETEADAALNGTKNPISVIGDQISKKGFDELVDFGPFQGANRDVLAAAASSINNPEDGVIFAAAMAGSKKYQGILAQKATGLYAGLQRAARDQYAEKLLNTPLGESRPAILPKFLERDFSIRQLEEDLASRDPILRKALDEDVAQAKALQAASDLLASEAQDAALIERIGGTSTTGMRVAYAWRQGAAKRSFIADKITGENAATWSPKVSDGTGPALYERVFEGASSIIPKFYIWDWVRGSHASGYIDIRGLNVGKSMDELRAALSDSRTIRMDKEFVQEATARYGAATTATERMEAVSWIERQAMKKMAAEASARIGREVKDSDIETIYKIIDKRRAEVVGNFKDSVYGVDPDTGAPIKAGALLRSQLETKMPMLNMRMLEKTMKIATKPHYLDALQDTGELVGLNGKGLTSQSMKNFVDEVQSLWKAGVLLRLGYTLRNTGEGWMRTAAFLGSIPAASDLPRGLANSFYNNSRRIKSKFVLKDVIQASDDAASKIDDLERDLMSLRDRRASSAAAQDPTVSITDLDQEIAAKENSVSDLRASLERILARKEDLQSRHAAGDRGAFGGDLNAELGDLYRKLSGAEQTTRNFLESSWARGQQDILSETSWGLINPDKPQYWNELASAIRQFRNDDIGRMLLGGTDIGDVVNWLRSSSGKAYRRDMRVSKEAAEARVTQLSEMINTYLPTAEARALAAERVPDPAELKAALGAFEKRPSPPRPPKKDKYQTPKEFEKATERYQKRLDRWKAAAADSVTLSPIHGRRIAGQLNGLESAYVRGRKATIDRLFNVLGTYPESTLVRHPFYAEVWNRRFQQLSDLARSQGTELTDDVLGRINNAAHRAAMRATNETLYTIERYSNVAEAMRWFAPFFPAWENSIKVWSRLVVNDPSILVRGSLLWQIPEKLGMVVDQDGNPVDITNLDFISGSANKYVTLPSAINDLVAKVSGGANVKIPLSSLNIITPGTAPFLPGFGPMVTYPIGNFLATKPDVQKALRDLLGPTVYEQIAPFGTPQDKVSDAFLPPAARKLYTWWQGESNTDYLRITGAMWQTAMVDWYRSGANPADKPDPDVVMKRAGQFLLFSAAASLALPFATTRTSPYQAQVDDWNRMKADTSMTYAQKVDSFITKWGDSFAPLITSTSRTKVPGVDPTIEDYNILRDNAGLARQLSEQLAPEAVGIIAGSAPLGEFDQGVYQWLTDNNIDGADGTLRGPRGVGEMGKAITMQAAWREYRQAKESLQQAMQTLGVKSLQEAKAAGLKQSWNNYVNDTMVQKYGAEWITEFRTYTDMAPTYLTAIQVAMNNKQFMDQNGSTPLWTQISTYMSTRQQALDLIAANPKNGKAIKDAFAAWANNFQYSSIQFSDFYDKFLSQDQLMEIGLSNIGI